MNQYTYKKLKNGLPLIIAPMKGAPSATVLLMVRAGARFETKRINGLAHFLEHMAFKGTKKRPTTLDIASEIDGAGGYFNAYTSREEICYHIKSPAFKVELSFDILSDVLQNSLFEKGEIEKEKGVIVEELNMYEDMPERKSLENFERLLYGDNSMGWGIGGTKDRVTGFKRINFLDYLKRFYLTGNMVLAVAGKVEEDKMVKLAEKYFVRPTKGDNKKPVGVSLNQKAPKVFLANKKTEQAHLALGLPAVSVNSPDYHTLSLLSAILGGSMSSRLFIQIRAKRDLAYYVSTIPEAYSDSGFLAIWAGVRIKSIDEAIKVTLAELHKLAEEKVGDKELKKGKELIKGRLALGLEDSSKVAERYAYQRLIQGKVTTPKETFAKVDQVGAEEIQSLARKLFKTNRLNLSLVGPFRNEGRFKKILKF